MSKPCLPERDHKSPAGFRRWFRAAPPATLAFLFVVVGVAPWLVMPSAHAADWPIAAARFSGSAPPNDYGTYDHTVSQKYHTGMDLKGSAGGCLYNTPVLAGVTGTVALVQTVQPCPVPAIGTCPGSGCPDHGVGNTVIVSGDDGRYYQYSHLDSISVTQGQPVSSPGTQVGIMGNSGAGVARRGVCPGVASCNSHDDFGPHLHFEVKTQAVLGGPSAVSDYGYSASRPDDHGWLDPTRQIVPITPLGPTVVRVVESELNVRGTPSVPQGDPIGRVFQGEKFVAFERSGSWFHVHITGKELPLEGWIVETDASCASGICAQTDNSATTVARVVTPATTGGVSVRTAPSTATQNDFAFIWEGQRFVVLETTNCDIYTNGEPDVHAEWPLL